MRVAIFAFLLSLLALAVLAAPPQRSVIVSYPHDTPESVLDEAKKAIIDAGGKITHSYHLIKAFAAKASETALETVQTYGQKYNALIEEDQTMHANGDAF